MHRTVIAIDIAKRVFRLHGVDINTGEVERLKLKRREMMPWFAQREPSIVAMEACGGAHEWGRQFEGQGHTVRLLPPKAGRPFVQRNKTDATDAQAIWIASLAEQRKRVDALQADITAIERRLAQQLKDSAACRAIAEMPGVGLLTATAAVATMGSPAAFENARQFAAWLELTPRQRRTGGKIRQLGISKRGDGYLRTLLMHGARAAIVQAHAKQSWPWLEALLQRRPYNAVVAAIANKMARTLWAILARDRSWIEGAWGRTQAV